MIRARAGNIRRIVLLDELRGLSVVLMIIYHGLYDLVYIFGVKGIPFHSPFFAALQLFICCSFILIAGISSRYSKSNIKRGLLILGIACLMTIITWKFMPNQIVLFGVLYLLGICMVIHGLIYRDSKIEQMPLFWGLVICLALFAATWGVSRGFIGFFEKQAIMLPEVLYSTKYLFPLGFPSASFYSSDYFPLLPWIFLFFAGSYVGSILRQSNLPSVFYTSHSSALRRIGRRSLLIYVLHQPVLYGILWLFFYIKGRLI